MHHERASTVLLYRTPFMPAYFLGRPAELYRARYQRTRRPITR